MHRPVVEHLVHKDRQALREPTVQMVLTEHKEQQVLQVP
jgi:hypothetical protein